MTSFSPNQQRFEDNINLLSKKNSLVAYQIQLIHTHQINFCYTNKQELNLCRTRYSITDYYHSQEGALLEAEAIAQEEQLKKTQVIYFYGLGLAYIYDALKSWLREKKEHQLVLLEDDLEVIHHFLYTERATEILQDSQVTLFYFENVDFDQLNFYKLHSRFINQKIYFLALPYYATRRREQSFTVCYRVLYDHSLMTLNHNEYLSGQKGFLNNFYRNMFRLSNSYLASGLFGKFKNIPAIICGAGPSIEKNVGLLKDLQNKALIFGGGSALNVLNAHHIIPHFGVGIDPNPEQYHRLLTNHTFHIPFFYRPRMAYEALEMVHGPQLYVPGSLHQLAAWFEEKLNIESPKIDEGHNVVNFCTEIAQFMGCNPIIYIGLDLAFTEIKTYATGIPIHPTWLGYHNPYAHDKEQQVILLKDIYNQPIKSKWDWILEADWISHYAINHPHLQIINATEGGLGFPQVPNQNLAETAQQYLKKPYDLQDWVHTEIQNNHLSIKSVEMINIVIELKKSLENCLRICSKLEQEQLLQTDAQFSQSYILNESLLQGEIGYSYFLDIFDKIYLYLKEAHAVSNQNLSPEAQQFSPVKHYQFLRFVLTQNLNFLTYAMQQFIFFSPTTPSSLPNQPAQPPTSSGTIYQFQDKQLLIKDAELNLDIEEFFDPSPSDVFSLTYPNQTLKMQSFYKQGHLHGPSRFYSDQGTLLAESWFINGQRQGKNYQFYLSGALYAIQRYKNNQLEGSQEYFYENGSLHMTFSYENGLLEGDVLIYNQEDLLVRRIQYHKGQRHGLEGLYNSKGGLLMECYYHNGIPTGEVIQRDIEGNLIRQLNIYQFPQDFDLSVWNSKGEVVQRIIHGIEDYSNYYSTVQQNMEYMEGAFDILMKHVDPMVEEYMMNETEAVQHANTIESISEIKKEIENLKIQKKKLNEIIKENLEQAQEARHKTQFPEKFDSDKT